MRVTLFGVPIDPVDLAKMTYMFHTGSKTVPGQIECFLREVLLFDQISSASYYFQTG